MPNDLVFHIRNAHPGDLIAALAALDSSDDLATVDKVVSYAETLGFAIRDRARLEALSTARDLGLVQTGANAITEQGRALLELEVCKPDLFADIVHGFQYSLWSRRDRSHYCFSWSYREICNSLWRRRAFALDARGKKLLASEVEGLARALFRHTDISVSPKSIGGASLWLDELVPEVIDPSTGQFSLRSFCAPELMAIAVDFVYRQSEMDYGTNLRLGDEQRDAICQVCLLEPAGFDRVLEYATAQFDYLDKGIGGGWGRYLTLYRGPSINDFVQTV